MSNAATPLTDALEHKLFDEVKATAQGIPMEEPTEQYAELCRQLERSQAALISALEPFSNYACDEPCECHNCKARAALLAARPK